MNAREMATASGLPDKLMYTVAETSAYTGIPRSALYQEIRAGRLRCALRRGSVRGKYVRPEDVDKWVAENSR